MRGEPAFGDTNADAANGTCEREGAVSGVRTFDRCRVAAVMAGDHAEDGGGIANGARERAHVIEGETQGLHAVAADHAVSRLEAGDSTKGCRDANGAAGIGTERGEDESGGDGGAGTAARSAGAVCEIAGVVYDPVVGIFGGDAVGQLMKIQFADDDGSGGFQHFYYGGAAGGGRILIYARAARGADAAQIDQVFEGDRDAVQGAAGGAGGEFAIGVGGTVERVLGENFDERVERAVLAADAVEGGAREFSGGDAAIPQGLGGFEEGHCFIDSGSRLYYSRVSASARKIGAGSRVAGSASASGRKRASRVASGSRIRSSSGFSSWEPRARARAFQSVSGMT